MPDHSEELANFRFPDPHTLRPAEAQSHSHETRQGQARGRPEGGEPASNRSNPFQPYGWWTRYRRTEEWISGLNDTPPDTGPGASTPTSHPQSLIEDDVLDELAQRLAFYRQRFGAGHSGSMPMVGEAASPGARTFRTEPVHNSPPISTLGGNGWQMASPELGGGSQTSADVPVGISFVDALKGALEGVQQEQMRREHAIKDRTAGESIHLESQHVDDKHWTIEQDIGLGLGHRRPSRDSIPPGSESLTMNLQPKSKAAFHKFIAPFSSFRKPAGQSTGILSDINGHSSLMPENADTNRRSGYGGISLPEAPLGWMKTTLPFPILLSIKAHLPANKETGLPLELRRIFRGDIIELHGRLYHFASFGYRAITHDYLIHLIGLDDGQEATARASTLLSEFRICTNIRYFEVAVLKLESPENLPTGVRYRALVQTTEGIQERVYVFSDGGESEFQFFQARKLAFKRKKLASRAIDPVMILYLMELDQRKGVFYVMGWRFPNSCILTKVKHVAMTPKHQDGRERELFCGHYCVRPLLPVKDKVVSAPDWELVEVEVDHDVRGCCTACGQEM